MAGFLVGSLLLVPLPYKQYFAPWLVLASIFVASLGALLDRAPRPLADVTLLEQTSILTGDLHERCKNC